MQYGIDVLPYERINNTENKNSIKKKINTQYIIKAIIYIIMGILISRVTIVNSIAPFGIALLIALVNHKDSDLFIFSCCGSLIGYISMHNLVEYIGQYTIGILIVFLMSLIYSNKNKVKILIITFTALFFEFLLYKHIISKYNLSVSAVISICEIACIIPLYYINKYSMTCFKQIKTKHIFTNEELITMSIFISIIIAGTYKIKIYNISITNILALLFILIMSYTNGIAIGTASGAALGATVGMCYGSMPIFVTIYALCGLITGVFKEAGRWLTDLALVVIFSILVIYCKDTSEFKILEPILSSAIFLGIPNKFYNKIKLELNCSVKEKYFNGNYAENVKGILIDRLNNFSDALDYVSKTMISLNENNKLALKNKSTTLIENLADKVCSSCSLKNICWKRELHYTYSAFGELIENYQKGRNIIPDELNKKCVNKDILLKDTDYIVNNYIVDELLKKRFAKGRDVLSNQVNNMSDSLKEIVNDFNYEIHFNIKLEKDISKVLSNEEIKFKNIIAFNDKKGRNIIKITLKACSGKQLCVKKILPLINKVVGSNMCIEEDGCNIDTITKECTVTFEEMPKYYVSSYIEKKCKEGEQYSGDTFSYTSLHDGSYMMILSDGMGSGPEAGEESRSVVQLIQKFMATGFSKTNVINIVNSIMSLRFCDEEKFSTVDMCNIDLYSGNLDFVKVGAVTSFIKSEKNVQVIKAATLPIGILDTVDVEVSNTKVDRGDLIIMISDGVMDYNNEDTGREEWIVDYLKNTNSNNTKDIAKQLIERSIKLSNGKIRDDMTVAVSKVYGL